MVIGYNTKINDSIRFDEDQAALIGAGNEPGAAHMNTPNQLGSKRMLRMVNSFNDDQKSKSGFVGYQQ